MKNRVIPQEHIFESIKRIPFLKRFFYFNNDRLEGVNISSMNDYMNGVKNYPIITNDRIIQSADFNVILEEAEKRGHL